ncbi:hypothetical protein AVEN_12666-1 [Araneus ventricosus]|uniref:Uncharacterized protein n=1 Tax=Araneus ventricosus TaxID=182803 RepID=A0A4Y2AAV7_ARAVE|nr:hypothetical protein AVEN_12666-1 [Araneus ventricosus]
MCLILLNEIGPQWPSGKVSGPDGSRFETRFHGRSTVYMGLLYVKSNVEGQTPRYWCGVEALRRGEVPAQVSSSSDRGLKLRSLFPNSLHTASKRDLNITKITHAHYKFSCNSENVLLCCLSIY